jgi:hypothetical protein
LYPLQIWFKYSWVGTSLDSAWINCISVESGFNPVFGQA